MSFNLKQLPFSTTFITNCDNATMTCDQQTISKSITTVKVVTMLNETGKW